MQPFLNLWASMDPRRRMMAVATTAVVVLSILGLVRVATTSSMTLLYSGLEPSAAGEVVQALEQRGVAFDIRSGSIFVEAARRDELRMTLAAEGLPANNGQGYELLDSLSGFGTTAQMFDAAYWRAKEGELARTILSNTNIASARVHIANTTSQPFRNSVKPTASVTITPAGGPLSASHTRALVYLVASAVAGLSPEDVSVIDSRNGLLMSGDEAATTSSAGEDRADVLRQNLLRLLEARVGAGKAVVEVSIESVTESEAIKERNIDPESRVAISLDVEERSGNSKDAAGRSVTVASNLPEGDGAGGGNSSSTNSETRERTNYEVSEITREVVRAPGAIKRMSVAVLLDAVPQTDPTTGEQTWIARGEEELASLKELVASASGFNAERGDSITVKSMQFETLPELGTEAQSSMLQSFNLDVMSLIQLAVLSVVSLVLGLFVLRPIFAQAPAARHAELAPPLAQAAATANLPAPAATAAAARTSASSPPAALTGEIDDSDISSARTAGATTSSGAARNDPATRLRKMISDRRPETVEILKSWIEDAEETA